MTNGPQTKDTEPRIVTIDGRIYKMWPDGRTQWIGDAPTKEATK